MFAYRLADNKALAYCPYCGKFHRIKKYGVMYHIKCPRSGQQYKVLDAVVHKVKV